MNRQILLLMLMAALAAGAHWTSAQTPVAPPPLDIAAEVKTDDPAKAEVVAPAPVPAKSASALAETLAEADAPAEIDVADAVEAEAESAVADTLPAAEPPPIDVPPLAPPLPNLSPTVTSALATQQAVERLIRSTRQAGSVRQPFLLEEGPADEAVVEDANDLETAILLIQEKDYTNAVPLLEKVLKQMPAVEAVWEALGWSYYWTGREQDAIDIWLQYQALRPDSPKPHSLLAQLAIIRRDWRAADGYLKKSLELEPKNYDIRYWYAQNLFRLGQLRTATTLMEELEKEDEDDMRYDVKVDLARLYSLIQRYEESLALWAEIVDAIDNIDFRVEYARALMLVGDLEMADAEARDILAEVPTNWPVMNMRADLAEISRNDAEIIDSLKQLLEDASDDEVRAKLRIRLANRYILLHRKDAPRWPLTLALDQISAALDFDPDNVSWLNMYAQTALQAHDAILARKTIRRVLSDFNPFNQRALRTLFELELLVKDFNAAERALNDLYSSYQPDNPYRFLDLARLEIQRGHYAEAMDALDNLEEAGNRGCVLTLLYHGLTESEWLALTSSRRLNEHLTALRDAGFTFIAPLDIPQYLNDNQQVFNRPSPKPWLARVVDHITYAFTGVREEPVRADIVPRKVVAVTFDDGIRNSFELGTPVAQDLGVPFGMFVMTMLDDMNAPMYATWAEIRTWMESGAWEIGSHLFRAHEMLPVTNRPSPVVYSLPNRVWLPEKNRRETMREWNARVRNEFTQSRQTLSERLGIPTNAPVAVAYPFGEIGQEEGCNVANIVNPIRSILNESIREFSQGFTLGEFGYTCAGENMMMIRRYEPAWDEESHELVENVLSSHPVFIARRMRAEIAVLMDKPHLADEQVELMRRDGYPERLLRELMEITQNKAPGTLVAAAGDDPDREGTSAWRIRPSNLSLGVGYRENKSNKQILQNHFELRGNLNLTSKVGFDAYFRSGAIEQTIESNYWYTVTKSETMSSRETRSETVGGTNSVTVTDVETVTTREVQTNRLDTYEYSADVQELRGSFTFRVSDSATVIASVGQKSIKLNAEEHPDKEETSLDEILYNITAAWRPYRTLQVLASYDHDLVPSAREKVAFDALIFNTLWKVADDWDLSARASYHNYDDDNALISAFASSFWQLFARQGIWAGVEGSTYSMDEKSPFYWSPYWDTRFAGVLRLRRAYQHYFFQLDFRCGLQKEKARPEDEQEYLNLKAQADTDGNWYPGNDPNLPWDTFLGLAATYQQRIGGHWDLLGSANINFLRDYSEHDYSVGLQYTF